MNDYNKFTSEFVGNGHPDRVCDIISDAILKHCLDVDKESRVAVETMAKDNTIVFGGEVSTSADLSEETIKDIVTNVLDRIGYNYEPTIINLLNKQSSDIALGVDIGGAGDQGIMFGYACNDTEDYMPMSYSLARYIIRVIESDPSLMELGPDMKSQVSYNYETKKVEKILISVQHPETMTQQDVYIKLYPIVESVLSRFGVEPSEKLENILMVNPTGRFVIGGPEGDCGVTGRKIVVDSYGAKARVGGGAYSGKDPTKVDRSAAYMCRYIAKNIVASRICSECEVYISYAIGVEQPFSLEVVTDNLFGERFDKVLSEYVSSYFNLSPRGIIEKLDLKNIDYVSLDMGNIYGENFEGVEQPWEVLDIEFMSSIKNKYIEMLEL